MAEKDTFDFFAHFTEEPADKEQGKDTDRKKEQAKQDAQQTTDLFDSLKATVDKEDQAEQDAQQAQQTTDLFDSLKAKVDKEEQAEQDAQQAQQTTDLFDSLKATVDKEDQAEQDAQQEQQTTDLFDSLKATVDKEEQEQSAKSDHSVPPLPVQTTSNQTTDDSDRDLATLHSFPIDLSIIIGRASLQVSDLLLIGQGSVIELEHLVGENLTIYANGKAIAQGSIVTSNEQYGCRITHILTPEERLQNIIMGVEKTG